VNGQDSPKVNKEPMLNHQVKRGSNRLYRRTGVGSILTRTAIDDLADGGLKPLSAWWQSFLRGADRLVSNPDARPLKIFDAFSGCGGLSLGVAAAAVAMGFKPEVLAAVDTDLLALDVHRSNLNTQITVASSVSSTVDFHISGSGSEASFAFFPQIVSREISNLPDVDVFLAGPPCEGHSNLNNYTRRLDPRNHLYLTAVALGVSLHSAVLIVENVPHVLNDKRNVVVTAEALLRKAGYNVARATIKADALGAPQRRTRFFLLAVKDNLAPHSEFAEVQRLLKAPAAPLSWALADLVDREPGDLMDQAPTLAPDNMARIEYLFQHDLYDLPDAERPECHRNGTSYRAVYGRMHWDKPAQTITTGFNTPGQGRYIHPLLKRVITPREAARIQGFPDWFSFVPLDRKDASRKNLGKWIGDAVPPILGYAAGLAACSALLSRR
jgi:DNA (cytosine-5)-methyltransferase 1